MDWRLPQHDGCGNDGCEDEVYSDRSGPSVAHAGDCAGTAGVVGPVELPAEPRELLLPKPVFGLVLGIDGAMVPDGDCEGPLCSALVLPLWVLVPVAFCPKTKVLVAASIRDETTRTLQRLMCPFV